MKTIFAFALTLVLFAACKDSRPSKLVDKDTKACTTAMVVNHPNYCILANGDINCPSGPIPCLADHHIDWTCVAAACAHYVSVVRTDYTTACSLARQYNKDHDTAVSLCNGDPACIAMADASLENHLTALDTQINANVTAYIAQYWSEAGACCVPDGH